MNRRSLLGGLVGLVAAPLSSVFKRKEGVCEEGMAIDFDCVVVIDVEKEMMSLQTVRFGYVSRLFHLIRNREGRDWFLPVWRTEWRPEVDVSIERRILFGIPKSWDEERRMKMMRNLVYNVFTYGKFQHRGFLRLHDGDSLEAIWPYE